MKINSYVQWGSFTARFVGTSIFDVCVFCTFHLTLTAAKLPTFNERIDT